MAIKKHDSGQITPLKKVVALPLLDDLRRMIEETRQAVATIVNTALTMLYWNVGRRIREDVLQEKRAEYGREILPTLSAKLTIEYGRGWNERNLAYMVKFAEIFPAEMILHALCAKLKEVLQEKLRKAIALARKQIESRRKERIAENVVKLLEGQ